MVYHTGTKRIKNEQYVLRTATKARRMDYGVRSDGRKNICRMNVLLTVLHHREVAGTLGTYSDLSAATPLARVKDCNLTIRSAHLT